jgi:hypothetical protein
VHIGDKDRESIRCKWQVKKKITGKNIKLAYIVGGISLVTLKKAIYDFLKIRRIIYEFLK